MAADRTLESELSRLFIPVVRRVVQPQPDVIVQIASDSPAWLTPAIAAGAAILSGFLAWLGTRLNDGRKATRERKERWDRFIIEEADALQRACELVHKGVRDKKPKSEIDEHLSNAWASYGQLSIVAPKPVVQHAIRFYGLAIQDSTVGRSNYVKMMTRHRAIRNEITDAIREYIGIPALKWDAPTPEDVKEKVEEPVESVPAASELPQ